MSEPALPEGWREVQMADVVNLRFGYAFSSADYQSSGAVRLLRGDNIAQGETRWGAAKWLESDPDVGDYGLRAGDVVLAMDRPWIEAGLKFAKVQERDLPALLVQRVARLRGSEGELLDELIPYVIGSRAFSSYVQAIQTGSAVPHISGSQIGAFVTPLPPLPEQRAIAEVLGALDDKIAANNRSVGIIDGYLSALFEVAIDRSVHVSRTLREIADVNAAILSPGEGQIRYLDIASVGQGVLSWPKLTDWSEAPSRARRGVKVGDTLWSSVRPGRRSHALVTEDWGNVIASTGLAVLSPRGVSFALLYEVARRPEFSDYLETVAEGSAYPAVKMERFGDAPVPVLETENERQFVAEAEALRLSSAGAERQSRQLAATRDALLPALMSGRLTVRDAEQVVADAT